MSSTTFSTYQSPYSWRYGSEEMRKIWGEINKRLLWRHLWVTLAEVQAEFGLVTPEQVEDLRSHAEEVNIDRAMEIESQIHHDLIAELKTFAEQCPLGGGIIHLGMTSMDIVDNADAIRIRDSLDIVLTKLKRLLHILEELIGRWADTPIMGFTHLQPAEPTTLGYRLSQYAQDLLMDWSLLTQLRGTVKGKGIKGAVGTSASFTALIGRDNLPQFEEKFSKKINLLFYPVATQVYPRKQDYWLLAALAGLGASLHKFALDLRFLQTPPIGEWAEPFCEEQIGSSAMPFKRNPIRSEKIDSLARMLAQFPRLAWDNAAHSVLERTLDDSANRRSSIPEAFLMADEIINTATEILADLRINQAAIQHTLTTYGPFAAMEPILMAMVKAGASRQGIHSRLRSLALEAWGHIQKGEPNPLIELIKSDTELHVYLSEDTLPQLLDATQYTGDAAKRARFLVKVIQSTLSSN